MKNVRPFRRNPGSCWPVKGLKPLMLRSSLYPTYKEVPGPGVQPNRYWPRTREDNES
jgi:hypothetical protein